MVSFRGRAFAFVLAASVLLTSAGALLTAEPHAACAAQHHDCGQTSKIAQCCCGEQDSTSSDGLVVPRVEVSASLTVAWVATPLETTIDAAPDARVPVHTAPTRGGPPDLPILFASFLI